MNNSIQSLALAAAVACTLVPAAQAAVVTSDDTSRASGSFFVDDSLNGRQWLAAEATRGLTYGAAQAAVASGGLYDGWRIATTSDALLYQQALVGSANCYDHGGGSVYFACNGDAGAATVFGDSYADYSGYGYDYDYVSVLSDLGSNVGGADLMQSYWDGQSTRITVMNWASLGSADYFASLSQESFGFLLTRGGDVTAAAIPEPGSLALASLAVLGVAATRRRNSVLRRLAR